MMQLPNAKLIKQVQQHQQSSRARHREPIRLIPRRRDTKVQGCAFFVPEAVVIAGDHAKAVFPRTKIAVESLTPRSRFLPSRIAPFQFVTKTHFLRHDEAQRGVVDLEITRERRKTKADAG